MSVCVCVGVGVTVRVCSAIAWVRRVCVGGATLIAVIVCVRVCRFGCGCDGVDVWGVITWARQVCGLGSLDFCNKVCVHCVGLEVQCSCATLWVCLGMIVARKGVCRWVRLE